MPTPAVPPPLHFSCSFRSRPSRVSSPLIPLSPSPSTTASVPPDFVDTFSTRPSPHTQPTLVVDLSSPSLSTASPLMSSPHSQPTFVVDLASPPLSTASSLTPSPHSQPTCVVDLSSPSLSTASSFVPPRSTVVADISSSSLTIPGPSHTTIALQPSLHPCVLVDLSLSSTTPPHRHASPPHSSSNRTSTHSPFDGADDFVRSVLDEVCSISATSASDVFPLPLLPKPTTTCSSSRRVLARGARSALHRIVYNHLTTSLNTLHSSYRSSSPTLVLSPSTTVGNNVVQRVSSLLHATVHSFLRRRGVFPISGDKSALNDSLPLPPFAFPSFDSYLSAPPIVPLKADLISLPSSPHPVPLLSLLPDSIAAQYASSSSPLLRQQPSAPSQQQLDTKPAMCSPEEWALFVRRLAEQNMVSFTDAPAVVNSVFCVAKPDKTQRFIINAILANLLFSDPLNPDLPTPDLIAALRPSTSGPVFAAKVDLECFYFFISLPEWLVPFFGMPAVRAGDISASCAAKFGADSRIFPCFNRLPMGWSHSVFLAQSAHLHFLLRAGVLDARDRISKENDLRLDRVRWFIYIDDFCIIGLDPFNTRRLQDAYLAAIRSLGFVAKQSKLILPSSSGVSLLGLQFVGSSRTYGLEPEKLTALCRDTRRFVSSTRASGLQLASLLGRWAWAMLVRRPLFAVLSAVFVFVQKAGSSLLTVWHSVRRELLVLLGLVPLLQTTLSSVVFPVAVAVDASTTGAGVVALESSAEFLAPIASSVSARCDPLLVSKSDFTPESSQPTSSLVATSIPPLLSSPARVASSFPWAVQEHINSLELRATLAGLRKIVSSPSSLSSSVVLLTDSAVAFFALRKGRSSSHALLRRVRPIAALSLAAGLKVCPVWIPSGLNPADAPSREWSISGKQRNRLAHAANGNTSSPALPFSLFPSSPVSSSSTITPLFSPSNSLNIVPTSLSAAFLSRPLPPHLRVGRALADSLLPPLRKASVAPSTLANYSNQLSYFFAWLAHNRLSPSNSRELDQAFECFLNSFFEARSGRGLALARNALFGLFLLHPQLRSLMPSSRRAVKGWEKLCPSVSHPPLSWGLTLLLSVNLILSSPNFFLGISAAVAMLVAWDAYLRVGELCELRLGNILFRDVGSVFKTNIPAHSTRTSSTAPKRLKAFSTLPVLVSLHLEHTKTGPNQWAQIRSPFVAHLLRLFLKLRAALSLPSSPHDLVFGLSTSSFRSEMARVCSSFGLSSAFTPHSLRHGHATTDYEAGATVQDIAVRGRWRTLDSLLIYVQSGPALSVRYRPSQPVASLATSIVERASEVWAVALRKRLAGIAVEKKK